MSAIYDTAQAIPANYATAGWYSRNNRTRQWDGSAFVTPSVPCIVGHAVFLGFGTINEQEACLDVGATYYIDTPLLEDAIGIWTDSYFGNFAALGFYAEQLDPLTLSKVREWDGAAFVAGAPTNCIAP
jgi:hypothetical protein